MSPVFLTLDEVLALHRDQIARYGGRRGVRDVALLSSAIGAPAATFDGEFLHTDLCEMAAAYLFHLARNHPFVDGNKRTALIAAIVFLGLNGRRLEAEPEDLFAWVDATAAGERTKSQIAVSFREWSRDRK